MELNRYKVLDHLGKSTWLAQETGSGRKYALKKVECKDEPEASDMFKEMCPILSLGHQLLTSYHHLFVSWDNNQAVYLCVVSDYIPKGNLEKYLSSQRSSEQWLEETLMKKWTGQLVEAVVSIHRYQLLHKNLKSSNVFISEDNNLLIGDIGILSKSSMALPAVSNWSPPESKTAIYDERFDMWSVGCIILEMCTTGCLSDADFFASLYQLKIDPDILTRLLPKVSGVYGEDMAQLIQSLIRQNYHQRPMAIELCDNPLILHCLSLYDSPLLQELNNPSDEQDKLALKLMKNKYSIESLMTLLQELIEFAEGSNYFILKRSCSNSIMASIDQYMNYPEILTKCFVILYSGYDPNCGQDIRIMKSVIKAMKMHSYDIYLVRSALRLLVFFSSNSSLLDALVSEHTVTTSLDLMRKYDTERDLLVLTYTLLINLTKRKSVLDAAVSEGLVTFVCKALRDHSDSAPMVTSSLSLLWATINSDDAIVDMCSCEIHSLISSAIDKHCQDSLIVRFGVGILAKLCEVKGDIAYLLADTSIDPTPLIAIVSNINTFHSNDMNIIQQYLRLLNALANYDAIKEELIHINVIESLSGCLRYPPTDDSDDKHVKEELQMLVVRLAN